MLRAFFDESERDNGLLCVAGYVFESAQARRFARAFSEKFKPYGGFHMKELVHKRKGYRGISNKERDRLLEQAIGIVRETFSYGVAVSVNRREYERHAPRFVIGFRNAYPFLCHIAMTATSYIVTKNHDDQKIHYVFEAGHAFQSEALMAISHAMQVPELQEMYRYKSHSFKAKADSVPLQAADLLAWEIGKFKNETYDEPQRNMRQSFRALIDGRFHHYRICFLEGNPLQKALNKYWVLAIEAKEDLNAERNRNQKLSNC